MLQTARTGLWIIVIFVTSYGVWRASEGNLNHQAVFNLLRFGETHAQKYIISKDSSDFNAAESTCKAREDGSYILASVNEEESWRDFTQYVRENAQGGSEFWVGGVYDTTSKEFCWVDLEGTRQERVYFAPFLYSHFDMVANSTEPSPVTRTILVNGLDKVESKISTRMLTSTRRFICQQI